MKYRDFINGINSGVISKASFSILDYPHYRNCIVESKLINPSKKESSKIIWFYLTPDGYEKKGFLNKIKEDTKLFYIKGKGSYSLKQIWDRVVIQDIKYSLDTDAFCPD